MTFESISSADLALATGGNMLAKSSKPSAAPKQKPGWVIVGDGERVRADKAAELVCGKGWSLNENGCVPPLRSSLAPLSKLIKKGP